MIKYLEISERFAGWLCNPEGRCKGARHGERVDGHCPRPEHDDKDPSFSYYIQSAGWKCSCGSGKASDLIAELGLEIEAGTKFLPESLQPEVIATYDYQDESGNLLYQVQRMIPKSFRQRAFKDGVWVDGRGSMDGVRRVPYRLPEVLAVPADQKILIVDGEKDVISAWKLGHPATCCVGGMSAWTPEMAGHLVGKQVTIVADRDPAGKAASAKLQKALSGLQIDAPVIEMPGDRVKDLTDWIAYGGKLDALQRLAMAAETWDDVAKSPVMSLSSLRHLIDERMEYLIYPVIPKSTLVMIQGAPKAGKSAFALHMAISAAHGVSPIDGWDVTRPIKILLVEFEDSQMLVVQRASSYLKGLGRARDDLPEQLLLCSYPELYLDQERYAKTLTTLVKEKDIDLVIIDTLSYVHRAKDENSSSDMKPLMAALKRMTGEHSFSVLLVHHTGKGASEKQMTDRGRGSTVISAAPDVIIDWGAREQGSNVNPVNYVSKYDAGKSFTIEYQQQPDGGVKWIADWTVAAKPERAEYTQGREDDILKMLQEETRLNPEGISLDDFIKRRCKKYSEQAVYRTIRKLEGRNKASTAVQKKRGGPKIVRAIVGEGEDVGTDWEPEVNL